MGDDDLAVVIIERLVVIADRAVYTPRAERRLEAGPFAKAGSL